MPDNAELKKLYDHIANIDAMHKNNYYNSLGCKNIRQVSVEHEVSITPNTTSSDNTVGDITDVCNTQSVTKNKTTAGLCRLPKPRRSLSKSLNRVDFTPSGMRESSGCGVKMKVSVPSNNVDKT